MNEEVLTNCNFGPAIMPYLYGELSGAERSAFESHLAECVECTDEFAEISHARYEVYDWKKLEFDPMSTPHFAIPYDEVVQEATWIEKVRAAFAGQWRVPGIAFGGIAVLAALGAFMVFFNNEGYDLVKQLDDVNVPMANDSSPIVRPSVVPANIDLPKPEISGDPVKKPAPPESRVRAESKRIHQARATGTLPSQKAVAVRPSTDQRINAPRLNEFADDEDESLRLAELFDDIGTRE